jgi:hypothetical protein
MHSRTPLQQLAALFQIEENNQTLNDESLQSQLHYYFVGVRHLIALTPNKAISQHVNPRKTILEKMAALAQPQKDHFFEHIHDVTALVAELQYHLKQDEPKNATADILDLATKNPLLFSDLVAYAAGCAELVRVTRVTLQDLIGLDEKLQTALIQNAATVTQLTDIIQKATPTFDMKEFIKKNQDNEQSIAARIAFFENAGRLALQAENYRLSHASSTRRMDRSFLDRPSRSDRGTTYAGINPALLAVIAHCNNAEKIEKIALNPRSTSSVNLLERLASEKTALKAQSGTESNSAAAASAAATLRSRGPGRKS